MYAKSIIEYVEARVKTSAWSKHLNFAPVVMALAVATLPFTLKAPVLSYPGPLAQPRASDADAGASAENPFAGLVQSGVVSTPKRHVMPLDAQQRAVASYVKRKYGVSSEVVQELVKTAFAAGKRYGVDPLLVVAIMAVESSYNPIAESYAGAKGLMQIIPKYHLEKFVEFGGEQAVFDPRVNILVGARILREYLLMHSGDLLTALQTYAGALTDREAAYTHRVLNEKDQLDALVGVPKTERRKRMVLQLEPERPGAITVPPLKFNLRPESAVPAATPAEAPPVPQLKPGEEAAHTPPTQPVTQPAPAAAPVNLTQAG